MERLANCVDYLQLTQLPDKHRFYFIVPTSETIPYLILVSAFPSDEREWSDRDHRPGRGKKISIEVRDDVWHVTALITTQLKHCFQPPKKNLRLQTIADYSNFLEMRRKLMAEKIRDYYFSL